MRPMPSPIFIDASIPIYAGGRLHPLREPARQILLLVADKPGAFFTDAEVLQELIHRYLALHLWPDGRLVVERFAEAMRGRVEPIYAENVEAAAILVDRYPRMSARDLLHTSVMQRVGSDRIVSADRDFDRVHGLQRLDPAHFAGWRASVEA